jgi:cell division protein FtsI/penicillin-binding protein 2
VVAVWRLVSAATRTRTEIGSLVAAGFAVLFGAEIAINVAGNLGMLPLAGVPFPLLSSGGSAIVAHCVAAGAVMGERRDETRRRLWCPPRFARPRPRLARLTAAAIAIGLVGLAASTIDLSQTDGPELRAASLLQATRTIVLPAGRGTIEDRHGVPLAFDEPVEQVEAIPSITLGTPGATRKLALLLAEPINSVDRALLATPPNQGFVVVVASSVPDTTATKIIDAHLPGVIVAPTVERIYPYASMLAPLLGFVGVPTAADEKLLGTLPPDELVGRAGLELEYDSALLGINGRQQILVDPENSPVAMTAYQAPVGGGDLRLSIDLGLQEQATAMLQHALLGVPGQPRGDEGSIVIMDPQNGQVLAMASLPAYNDNLFGPPVNAAGIEAEIGAPGDPFLEHATQTAMPPGSTYKLVVASADLATGVVPATRVVTTGSLLVYDGQVFHNWGYLPPQDLPQAVAWSNDVYFYKLAIALGAARIDQAAVALGVGQATGIDLPGEASGFLGTPANVGSVGEEWYPGTTAMSGIGQGPLTVTPLQDARWTAAAATGMLVTPRLGLSARPAGSDAFVPLTPPAPQELPFAAQLGPLQQGLRDAVVHGTGTMLRSLPIPAAGKTGTAQDSSAPDGGPDAWYTAYSPADTAAQVVVTVNVRGGGQGYNTAEPIARDLLRYFDAHSAQIMSTAPAQPSVPPAVAAIAAAAAAAAPATVDRATAQAAKPAPAPTQVLPTDLRRQRARPAGRGSSRHLQPRTSGGGLSNGPEIRTRPRGGLRIPATASHRRRRGLPRA